MASGKKAFDPSSLKAFGNAAAGHDGVLSDETGAVVVKPCTQAEIDFYQSVNADHPNIAQYLPTFMGSLSRSANQEDAEASVESGTIQTEHGVERLHGKKLDTELHIVLENITAGFKKPNVLDLKLGAQLWDEKAKPDKRRRLDDVSAKTTSGSLGFRIAGMRTWQGADAPAIPSDLKDYVEESDGYWVYNKMYGRKFSADDVPEGFTAYVLPQSQSDAQLDRAWSIVRYFLDEVKGVLAAFEKEESRMYSASILLVYEGDIDEYGKTAKILSSGEIEQEDDEDAIVPKLAAVKVIDFAHATWHPGEGPDENSLRGMRSIVKILDDIQQSVDGKLAGGRAKNAE